MEIHEFAADDYRRVVAEFRRLGVSPQRPEFGELVIHSLIELYAQRERITIEPFLPGLAEPAFAFDPDIYQPDHTHVFERHLIESKNFGSIDVNHPDVRSRALDQSISWQFDAKHGARTRQRLYRVGQELEKLRKKTFRRLTWLTDKFQSGKFSKTQWRKDMKSELKELYLASFGMGLRSGHGVKGDLSGKQITTEDSRWAESAYRHEMKFFNKLLLDIERGTSKTPIKRRLKAYTETTASLFSSARVLAYPHAVRIDWVLQPAEHCDSCRFLKENGPYTKFSLPCTPRSGLTKCLNGCKCILRITRLTSEKYEALARKSKTRDYLTKQLLAIKAGR